MRSGILTGLAVVVLGLASAWFLDRWLPRAATTVRVIAAVSVRLLAAAAVAWALVRIVADDLDPLRVLFAAVISLLGLWFAVSGLATGYLALFRRNELMDSPDQT